MYNTLMFISNKDIILIFPKPNLHNEWYSLRIKNLTSNIDTFWIHSNYIQTNMAYQTSLAYIHIILDVFTHIYQWLCICIMFLISIYMLFHFLYSFEP